MAVVVDINERGAKEYRSVNGLDRSSEEIEQADKLDIALTDALKSIAEETVAKKGDGAREKVALYWKLGHTFRCLMDEVDLIPAERTYFFLNVKCRAPEVLRFKDRGPKRDHFIYCYRLAGYTKNVAELLKWSEWSYLFDSPGINSEIRFDDWFEGALAGETKFFNRQNVRLLGKVLNAFFKNMETSDLTDEEISRCYEAAKLFCVTASKEGDGSRTNLALAKLKKKRLILAQVMSGKMPGSALFDAALNV